METKTIYRLMIVDDEDDERLGIRFLLNKSGFQFHLIEAENGKEALEKLEKNKVDILLTDVKMPFLNGIELSKIVRERFPEMQIVFFSGYDDFEYAKQALSIQAVDYILKPVNPAEFKKVIENVVEKIEKKKTDHLQNRQFHRVYALTRLLNQIPYETLKSEYRKEDLFFLHQYNRMLLLEFEEDFFGKKVEDVQELNEKLRKILCDTDSWNKADSTAEYGCGYELLDQNPAQGILLFSKPGREESYYRETAKCIYLLIAKEYDTPCFVAVSPQIHSPKEIGDIYQETESYLEERFFHKDTYIYPIELSEKTKDIGTDNVNQFLSQIEEDIKFRDVPGLRKNMEIMLEKCRSNSFESYIYTRFICSNLMKILFQGIPPKQHLLSGKIEEIYQCSHFSEIEESIKEVMNMLLETLSLQQDTPKHVISIVEKHIHEHYMDILSLDILADKVYLTPHYLSSIFSQEKGIGINKYIKKIRMEKAEELLRLTNMKISDICQAVGYTNLSYFCKTFRNEYGVTPEKYRDR